MNDLIIERVDRADGHQQWVVKVNAPRSWPGYPIELPLEDFRQGAVTKLHDEEMISPLFTLEAMRADWV